MDMSSSDEENATPAQSTGMKTALSAGTKDVNG